MSRDIYLDRDDIEAIVMALRAQAPHYQDMAQKNASIDTHPARIAAGYARKQRRRVESIATRLSGLGQAIVTERPHR